MSGRGGGMAGCALVVLLFVTEACRIGANPSRSPVARGLHGTMTQIDWRGSDDGYWSAEGELFVVADSGVFLLHDRSVVFYPAGAPVRLRPTQAPGVSRVDLANWGDVDIQGLRSFARHPFGLDDSQILDVARSMRKDAIAVRRSR
jgi:hypothetical protein